MSSAVIGVAVGAMNRAQIKMNRQLEMTIKLIATKKTKPEIAFAATDIGDPL